MSSEDKMIVALTSQIQEMNKLLQGTNLKIKSNSEGKSTKHMSRKINKRFKKKQNSKTKARIEFEE